MIVPALLLALSFGAATPVSSRLPDVLLQGERFGLWGLGISLEAPMIGVLAQATAGQQSGFGYSFGTGLAYDVTPRWVVRAYIWGGETSGGTASLGYRENDQIVQARAVADWLGLQWGLGAAHFFRRQGRDWTPFVGVDAGMAYQGYSYTLTDELDRLVGQGAGTPAEFCGSRPCPERVTDSLALGYSVGARVGLQMLMRRWLATEWELSCTFAPGVGAPITNTLTGLEVTGSEQATWLIRTSFSVKLGV